MAKQYTAKYKSLPLHSATTTNNKVEKDSGETPDGDVPQTTVI